MNHFILGSSSRYEFDRKELKKQSVFFDSQELDYEKFYADSKTLSVPDLIIKISDILTFLNEVKSYVSEEPLEASTMNETMASVEDNINKLEIYINVLAKKKNEYLITAPLIWKAILKFEIERIEEEYFTIMNGINEKESEKK